MDKEFSAGAVIFRKVDSYSMFLLLYSNRNKEWGFPKGHMEPGETEKAAALREIKEETGLSDLKFVDGFREELIYKAKSNRGSSKGQEIEKHSVYFLCQADTEAISTDGEEITEYRWCSITEALELIKFNSMKDLLNKAYKYGHK